MLRTISMLVNEASEAVLHAIATEQDIDSAMKYGVNYPQGPFQWAEKLDITLFYKFLKICIVFMVKNATVVVYI